MTSHVIASGVTSKILTHEVGAGAPCLKCGDKCPGLDLHFWRKICRNCKCKQENHDVNASVSSRGMDNIEKLLLQDNVGDINRSPTAIKKTNATPPLPAPKPVTKRNETIETPSEVKIEQINGDVQTEVVPEDVLTKSSPIQLSETETFEKNEIYPEPPEQLLNKEVKNNVAELPIPPPQSNDVVDAQVDVSPPQPTLSEEFDKTVDIKSSTEIKKPDPVPPTQSNSSVVISERGSVSDRRPLPPDNEISYTKEQPPVVKSVSKHDTTSKEYLSRDGMFMSTVSSENEEEDYEWTPPVSDQKLIQKYIQSLPTEKRPVVGTEGAKYRKKQLMRQLPAHDQEPKECHDLSSQETTEMELFVKQYRQKALGVAKLTEESSMKACFECQGLIEAGNPIIQAERAGAEKSWHPACFTCAECRELLVDLIYFYNEDKIYCGRHYCELHKPRCAACDELIFAPEYTQAEDSYWHLKHFCCWHCDQPLGGKNYVPHENQPICIPCYEKTFAHTCATCKEIIAPNTEWVTFERHHWHARAECFKCIKCDQSLVGKPCIPKGERVFCSSKCKREYMSTQK